MLTALIVISILLLVSLLVIRNLLLKVEKYEEDNILKEEFIVKFKTMIEEAHKKVKELDSRGAFEADDEVGFFFKELMNVSLGLDAYFKNYVQEEDVEKK